VGVGDPAEGAGQTGRPAPTRTPGRSAAAGTFCTATVAIASRWPGGYQAEVTVANTGATALTGWTVAWTFANGEAITQLWNGQDTASGAQHSVRNADYNGALAPGTSTPFGFTVNVAGAENAVAPSASCAAAS
jgi:cellulase/cellobiase CelA1